MTSPRTDETKPDFYFYKGAKTTDAEFEQLPKAYVLLDRWSSPRYDHCSPYAG